MTNTLNLDDMKSAWQQLDQRLARIETQNATAIELRHGHTARARRLASTRALRPLLVGQLLQALFGAALIVLAATFWTDHLDRLHLVIAGISLHVYGIWLVATAGYELSLLKKIRHTTPVVEMQTQLATLRRWRARNGLVFAYAGCFVWIPAVLMVFAGLGADVWMHQPAVVGWFLVSAFVCAACIHVGLRWANSPQRPRLAAEMAANAAGQSVRDAEIALEDLERFDAEAR